MFNPYEDNLSWCSPVRYRHGNKICIFGDLEGVETGGIACWENGKRVHPDFETECESARIEVTHRRLAEWFGVDPDGILDYYEGPMGCYYCPCFNECESMDEYENIDEYRNEHINEFGE